VSRHRCPCITHERNDCGGGDHVAKAEHPRSVRAYENRRPGRSRTTGCNLAVTDLEVRAIEVHLPHSEQRRDDPDRFVESTDSSIEVEPEAIELAPLVASTEAKDQTSFAHLVEGDGHLGQKGRIAETDAHHP